MVAIVGRSEMEVVACHRKILPQSALGSTPGRVARHDFPNFRSLMRHHGSTDAEIAEPEATNPDPEHPVICIHPGTGRRGIYVDDAFTQEILGISDNESAELLTILYAQAAFPEYQVRLSWEPNSIAFWDDRACQRCAASDYRPNGRRVERVTIVSDTPHDDASQAPTDEAPSPFRGQLRAWSDI